MTVREGFGNKREKWRVMGTALVAAGTLALAGCNSNSGGSEAGATGASTPIESQPHSSSPTSRAEGPLMVFDDLGGGSSIIQVYPGVTNSEADKQFNGTFNDGDSVTAECKLEGRSVSSHPEVGEEERTSKEWIRIQGVPGVEQYATAVYIEHPEVLLPNLSDC